MPIAGRTTRQRVLDAVRWYFREYGLSPSHSEIATLAGIAAKRVQGYLKELQRLGVLQFTAGVRCSIVLVDRGANLSDDELERACHGRNWTVTRPAIVAQAAVSAFPLPEEEGVANWGLKLLDELNDIPGTRDR